MKTDIETRQLKAMMNMELKQLQEAAAEVNATVLAQNPDSLGLWHQLTLQAMAAECDRLNTARKAKQWRRVAVRFISAKKEVNGHVDWGEPEAQRDREFPIACFRLCGSRVFYFPHGRFALSKVFQAQGILHDIDSAGWSWLHAGELFPDLCIRAPSLEIGQSLWFALVLTVARRGTV